MYYIPDFQKLSWYNYIVRKHKSSGGDTMEVLMIIMSVIIYLLLDKSSKETEKNL
jgi:hypothetical protein